eukprot:CAMPEP_0176126280 /NCGR_PEP_ID=MMETSP0120_2-20121206/63730_1 /TAXON_ID=160619 /ORGANISM="Kryptoperidinium foliaceum, Strain CCMP 1326" /LENGTH=89 /DNA_ID=CAMNT_0017461193 /DNA_START=142 /DNA_END=410 /DNA_ORIENTATION=+
MASRKMSCRVLVSILYPPILATAASINSESAAAAARRMIAVELGDLLREVSQRLRRDLPGLNDAVLRQHEHGLVDVAGEAELEVAPLAA